MQDLFKFGVVDDKLALNVHDLFARVRVVYLRFADAELGETAEGGLEHFDEAGVHVLNDSIVVQFLNTQVQLAQQLALLYCHAHFLQAADRLRHDQVRVDVALQQVPQKSQNVLIDRSFNQSDLSAFKVDIGYFLLVHYFQNRFHFVLVENGRPIQELILEYVLNDLRSSD